MLKSKLTNNAQEVILPDFPDDDNTVTTTVTKSRRVSFGTNFVKEFIVGSAVSAQCMSEYEQAFPSSDSSAADSSHSAAESGLLNHSTFVMSETHKPHKMPVSVPPPPPPSEPDPGKTCGKPSKFSSTICFSVDSPTADLEFTEGCITLAKSILDKKNKEMKVIIQAKPKDVDKSKIEETKYFDGSEFDMSVTRCLKSTENKRKEKIFEGEKTKIFNTFDDEMSMTRVNKPFTDDDSDISWEESKENRLPIDLIMRHLDKDDSDSDNDLFNPSKSFNNLFSPNPFDLPNESEKLNLDESMEITSEFPPNVFKTPAPVSKPVPLAEKSSISVEKSFAAEEMDISFDAPKTLEQAKVIKTSEVVVSEMMEINFESGDVLKQRKSLVVTEEKSIEPKKSKVFNTDESMEVDADLPGVVAEDIRNKTLNIEPIILKSGLVDQPGNAESNLKNEEINKTVCDFEPDSQSKHLKAAELEAECQPRLSTFNTTMSKSCLKNGFQSDSGFSTEASTEEKERQDNETIDNGKRDSELVPFNEDFRRNESLQSTRPVIATDLKAVDPQNEDNNESFKDGFKAAASSSDSFLNVDDLKDSFEDIEGDEVFSDSKLSCKDENYGHLEKSMDVNDEMRRPDSPLVFNPRELSHSVANEMSLPLKTNEKTVDESCQMDVCEDKTLELKIPDMTVPLESPEKRSVNLEDSEIIASQVKEPEEVSDLAEAAEIVESDVPNLVEEEFSKADNMSLAMDLTKPVQGVDSQSLDVSKPEVSECVASQGMNVSKPTDISEARAPQAMIVSQPTTVSEPELSQTMDVPKSMNCQEAEMSQAIVFSNPAEVSEPVVFSQPIEISEGVVSELDASKPTEVERHSELDASKPIDVSEPENPEVNVSKPINISESEMSQATPIESPEHVRPRTEVSQPIKLKNVSKSTESEVIPPSSEVDQTAEAPRQSNKPAEISALEMSMDITEPVQVSERIAVTEPDVAESTEVESPVVIQSPEPDVEREPSLVDLKVLESLKEQSTEPGCVWSLKDFQHPKTRSSGVVAIDCKLLESTACVSFSLKMTHDDSLDSCSDVSKTNIELLEENQHHLPEYFLVVDFGFAQLKKYFEERIQEVRTIRHIPYFLDQINPVVSKMNSFLKQINTILTSYPGSRLDGSVLSFRLFSFPIFFSALVYIDLSHLFRLSQTSLSFEVHFGSFKESKIREIFQDCLKRENPLYEFVVQSTKYLFDIEKGSGYVSKRRHIRLLPSELRL